MRTKAGRGLTALRRQALECVREAHAKGVSLSTYCRASGVVVRQVYDARIALRRRGLLPARAARNGARAARSSAARFVAVKIAPRAAPIACRVRFAGGILIECAQWPPHA